MPFLHRRIQSRIAALPLPAQADDQPDPAAAAGRPDFDAILARLRRSGLDAPLDPRSVRVHPGPRMHFVRILRVPRPYGDNGRPGNAHYESALLNALHGLGSPLALRVDSRGGELQLALGMSTAVPLDSLVRSMVGHLPGVQVEPTAVEPVPTGRPAALLVGTSQPPPKTEPQTAMDLGSVASALQGREWGLVVRAYPVSRAETTSLADAAAAQLRTWSFHLREGRDASNQNGQISSQAVRREQIDRQAQLAIEWTEILLGRLTAAEREGLWEWSGLLWAMDDATLRLAASLVSSLFGGPDALPEPFRAVLLPNGTDLRDLSRGGATCLREGVPLVTQLPSSQLASLLKFPRESTPGFSALPSAGFSTATAAAVGKDSVDVGAILDRGRETGHILRVQRAELARHAGVFGMTGGGKTNGCITILRASGLPFLVIEPSKNEYRTLLRDPVVGPNLQVFTLGDESTAPFRVNPFECPDGFLVSTHADFVKSAFTSSFAMPGPLANLLDACVTKVYEKRGWDFASNTNRHQGRVDRHILFPTLSDLFAEIDLVVGAVGYGQELSADIRGALKARIGSLLVGAKGLLLGGMRSTPIDALLDRPTVLELGALGDEEKALVMSFLLVALYEHRQLGGPLSGRCVHLTCIEEAHRVLQNVSTAKSPDIGNAAGKAVQTFNQILSEIRAYGEGIMIAEQIPSKLSPDALKNTGLKLVYRLQAADDRAAVGDTMVLSPAQKDELARLAPHTAVAFGGGLAEAVLVKVAPAKPEFQPGFVTVSNREVADRARQFQAAHPELLERFPGCRACSQKCRRPPLVRDFIEGRDEIRYQAFCRLMLAWTLGATPDDEALESIAPRSLAPGDANCLGVHLLNRYMCERAGFYRLTATERASVEAALAARIRGDRWMTMTASDIRDTWLPYAERKSAEQRRVCRECRSPFCYGYEMDRCLDDLSVLDRFNQLESDHERQQFLTSLSASVLGAETRSLQHALGYCFFVRRLSELKIDRADAKYNRLMETLS